MSDPSNFISLGPNKEYKLYVDQVISANKIEKIFKCIYDDQKLLIVNLCATISQVKNKNQEETYSQEEEILKIIQENQSNQNIVKIIYFEYIQQQNSLVVIMEEFEMQLQDLIDQNKKFSNEEIFDFLNQFINGYKTLYDNNIIHRDLKPEYI